MKFTLATSQGTQQGSFFDLLSAVADGSLLDLPRLRPHQRGPVVTAVAVVMTALRRYAASPPQAAQEWESEWMRQVGPDALRMIAPAGEVAFFQPPLPNDIGHPASDIPLSAVDFTLTRVAHEIKPQRTGTPEQWIYALMSGAWSLSLAKWHGGARQGLTVALPSVGGSIGSEIATLVRAYEGHRPTVVGVNTKPSRAADHFVWMRPHGDTLTVDTLPYPSVEAQPYHLVEESGVLKAVGRHSLPLRIQKEAHLEDPHVPLIAGQPFKLKGCPCECCKG
jgi:hypothetical protein